MAPLRFSVVFILGLLGTTCAQNFYVATPSTLRLNADQTIAVAVEGNKGSVVDVFIQDYPGKIKNITHTILPVQPDEPELFKVLLDPANFPPNFLNSPGSPKLVSVTAVTDKFRKEIIVPITTQSGYVFIQTDKPIYTPNQRVHMRIISLNEAAVPSNKGFKLQIMNPDGIIVEEKIYGQKTAPSWKAFETHIYKFPLYPVLGKWSAMVRYGYEFQENTTVYFELQEYVLPTFTVDVETPDVILPLTNEIKIGVTAKYVYGKKVQGIVTFLIGVKAAGSSNAIFFATLGPKELDQGKFEQRIKTDELKNHKDIGWFPTIEGSQLVVEATVVDDATGNNEKATNVKTQFSKSPFAISFKRCLSDFKPGLNSVFQAVVTHVDGKPAAGISTKITAKADGKPLNIPEDTAVSDEDGKVTFEIQPELQDSIISVTLETNDERYVGSQAVGTFEQHKFQSPNKAYISIARSTAQRLQAGNTFSKLIHFEPEGIPDIYYMIVSKGKIIGIHKLPPGAFKVQTLKFQVTHEMVPSFRLVVFAHYKEEFIADSLKVDVERVCDPKAEVTVEDVFNTKEPGGAGKINLRGTSGTWVGLLGVDEAVYALSKKDLLTKAKMFDKLASHDLGCGPGGGITVNQVLGNAGITIGTNKYTPTLEHSCVEIKRKKREAALNILDTYETDHEKEFCALGITHDKYGRTCQERTNIVVRELKGECNNCSKAFLECCIYAEENGITEMVLRKGPEGRIGGVNFGDLDFIEAKEEEAFEKATLVRSDFRETWIFEDLRIGSDGKKTHEVSLPHSITTWVISAVSVSEKNGMCVAEPRKLVSFKKIFLHLNLPYSVVRNEQVEVQATVFNYGSTLLPATVYMYGVKDLCTGTQPGQKSERKRLAVKPNSGETVSFPVVPLKAEIFKIKVVVLTPEGSDVIEKDLRVVPEGVTKEIDIPIKLDPSNQRRRGKRHINTKEYSDTIDPAHNLQVTAVKLAAPEGFVPGTASCSITALGDQMGPVVETAINNPDGLLNKPRGCGEQNMMFLAPTLYTMRYLKVAGKLTAESESKGYAFIRTGYGNQLAFRKEDGSYAAYQSKPTSTWLTAFVMKVFCQANELVHIDENVLCSGVRWLMNNQEPDGSYVEKSPMYHLDMMGGVQGSTPMTAFALIALEECKCDEENLLLVKKRAVAYLEAHLGDVTKPLPVAIVAYAMALSGSDVKGAAYDKLQALAKTNEDENLMYWETQNSAQDIETAGYGLLTHLFFNDLTRSASIVNWLNTKQLQSGSFKSTQDTVMALQAMSEYAIRAQMPPISLVANITSSNDRNFHKVLTFHEDNALILQDVKVDKIGGTLFINTAGHGVGSLAVKLRYNLIVPPEKICRFDVKVDLSEPKQNKDEGQDGRIAQQFIANNNRGKDVFDKFPPDLIRGVAKVLDEEQPLLELDPRNRGPLKASLVAEEPKAKSRVRRQNQAQQNSKIKYTISVCARYLGNKDAEMSIVDVGIFSGFEPDVEVLKELEEDPNHLIQRYEKSSRGVVFYLQRVPIAADYCFSFPIINEYLVGNTQMSVVKVYDYYNPDETCTKFYSPASNSPILHKICEGGTCECAEGGCASEKALADTAHLERTERRKKIIHMACENYDYVWKGKLSAPVQKNGGFLNISFTIDEVIKEGIEKKALIEGETRTLLSRDNCPVMFQGQEYMIMGRDGQKYKNSEGVTWYRYLLDQTSVVHMWTTISAAKDKELQRALIGMAKSVGEKGCLL